MVLFLEMIRNLLAARSDESCGKSFAGNHLQDKQQRPSLFSFHKSQGSSTNCRVIIVPMKTACHPGSHVISLLVSSSLSLFHLPRHEGQRGPHNFLQHDTENQTPLPKPMWSTSRTKEPLSLVNYESDLNQRNNSHRWRIFFFD